MKRSTHIFRHALVVAVATAVTACGDTKFPTTPTPLANSPVTTQQAATYGGSIVLPDGGTTTFNMTLIARSLGVRTESTSPAPGTVSVSGSYSTGNGLHGDVQGTLAGTLAGGTFTGTLTAVSGACTEERTYSGPVTTAGVAWLPGEQVRNCSANALTFSMQMGQTNGPACPYNLSQSSVPMSGSGGTASIQMTAPAGCAWVAESGSEWIDVRPSSGTGSATVTITVEPNAQTARQVAIRIAGLVVTVDQGPACSLAISPARATIPSSGGTGTIAVTAGNGCEWSAESRVDWITVSTARNISSGSLSYSVARNTGAQREDTIRVAGQAFAVTQDAAAPPECSFVVDGANTSFGSDGGKGTISVRTPSACAWTARSNADWIVITGAAEGHGNATVTFVVRPNTAAQRSSTITVADKTVPIVQGQALVQECRYAISPASSSVRARGEVGRFAVSAQVGCPWTVVSDAKWVTTSTASGNGDGVVTFTVQENSGAARTGGLRLLGGGSTLAYSVFQAAPTLTVIVNGSGTIQSDGGLPAAINCTKGPAANAAQVGRCTADFDPGRASLRATPAPGWFLSRWDVCSPLDTAAALCALSVAPNGTYTVTATFSPALR